LTLPPENVCIFGSSEGNNNELPDGNLILHSKIKGRVLQSAADLPITMIAGGNHTEIKKTLPYRDCAVNRKLQAVCENFLLQQFQVTLRFRGGGADTVGKSKERIPQTGNGDAPHILPA